MPQLNVPGSGHVGPAAVAGWQWLPIPTVSYRTRIQAAVNLINSRIKAYGPCNSAFRSLPGGRSFAQVWSDPAVWTSYDPGGAAGRFGATLGNEVTVSQYTCRMGHWTLVATIIHEMAHVDGADGVSHDAEATLQNASWELTTIPESSGRFRRRLSQGRLPPPTAPGHRGPRESMECHPSGSSARCVVFRWRG